MARTFRKYHRLIAIAVCLPLFLTVLSGIGISIFDEWFHQDKISNFLLRVHTLDIFGLEGIYPVLNGLGLLGLLITGLTMTNLFKKRSQPKNIGD